MKISPFVQRYFIHILIISGFIGFCATLLVYIKSEPFLTEDKSYTFHEPVINKNDVVDIFNKNYVRNIDSVFKKYDSVRKRVAQLDSIKAISSNNSIEKITDTLFQAKESEDSLRKQLLINNDSDRIVQAQFFSLWNDTLRKYRPGKIIKLFDQAELKIQLKQLNVSKDSQINLSFLMIDTIHKDFPLKQSIPVPLNKYKRDNVGFFEKYPNFGLWVLFTCTTVAVWCILLVTFLADIFNYRTAINGYYENVYGVISQALLNKLRQKTDKGNIPKLLNPKELAGFLIYSVVLVFVFIGIQFITVYDHSIIPVSLFIENYHNKFLFFLITGGVVSSFFFGGYLTVGEVLKEITLLSDYVNRERYKNGIEETKKTDLDNAATAIGKICDLSLNNLTKYFYITSFILTAVVIVTGVLFSAINNMDISKLYKESFNSNFLNYDIIYLFGGLYSLLILFFYLPLRLTFSQVKAKYTEAEKKDPTKITEDPQPKKNTFYPSKDLINRFKEIFTVSTPLLAAIIQLIIEMFAGNN